MQQILSKHGVVKVAPEMGDAFDATVHEATFQVPGDASNHSTIAACAQAGYTIHGRVLRPANVGVFHSPEAASPPKKAEDQAVAEEVKSE